MVTLLFSFHNNYEITQITSKHFTRDAITPREVIIEHLIKSVGVAASVTLLRLWEDPRKARKKLDGMVRSGFLKKYKLEGEKRLNIFTLNRDKEKRNLDELLRCCSIAQFYIRMKELMTCNIIKTESNIWYFKHNSKIKQVLSFRIQDNPNSVKPLLKNIPTVIVSDYLVDYFDGYKARIVIDQELIDKEEFRFFLPNGEEDKQAITRSEQCATNTRAAGDNRCST